MDKLIEALKVRLQSSGKMKHKDESGNDLFIEKDIFTDDQFTIALETSMSMLEQFEIPGYVDGSMPISVRQKKYQDLLVQGATIQLLAGMALVERGREFVMTDNGVRYSPPSVSEILITEWQFEYQMYLDKIRLMK